MNRTAARRIPFAVIALLLSPELVSVAQAQAPAHKPNEMSIWQARRTLTIKPKNENVESGLYYGPIRFSADSFEFDTSWKKVPETVRIDLQTAPAVKVTCSSDCRITDESGRPFQRNIKAGPERFLAYGWWRDLVPDGSGHMIGTSCRSVDCRHEAETFAAAFNVLSAYAKDTNAPLRTFPQRAAAWRALATKPPIPEEVNVQRLMAEDAIKENKPDEALNYYENGIELYPTWPEGNFNAALIAAELKYYADAIEHMQAYLELVPNAPDAQAAHEKILIWKIKAKQ